MSDTGREFIDLLFVTAWLGAFRSALAEVVALAERVPGLSDEQMRAAWARCPVEGRLHLLTARAVLDLATLGRARACCGALILTPRLVLRGGGTPGSSWWCVGAGSPWRAWPPRRSGPVGLVKKPGHDQASVLHAARA